MAIAKRTRDAFANSSKRSRLRPKETRQSLAIRTRRLDLTARSFPGISPHFRIPAPFVDLYQIEIGHNASVVLHSVLLDHGWNEAIGLVVTPAAFAHKAVVDENFFRGQTASFY